MSPHLLELEHSKIQRPLPPITPAVRNRILNPRNITRTNIFNSRVNPIHPKRRRIRDIRALRRPALRKGDDEVLKRNRSCGVDDAGAGPVEVGVWDILAVQPGWGGEIVAVRLVVKCEIEVARVAGEAEFRGREGVAADLVGKGRGGVEDVGNVGDCGGCRSRESLLHACRELCGGVDHCRISYIVSTAVYYSIITIATYKGL